MMDMGFCSVASSIVPMAYETEAFSGRPFVATVDSSVVDSLFVKDEAEEVLSERTYMEMQPVTLEPLNDERVVLTSNMVQCSSTEMTEKKSVSVDKATCTDLNVAALLKGNAQMKELLKSLRSEVRELKDDQKFAQMRIDRLKYENSELKRELVVQKEVVKNVESSRQNLLLCTEFFHLKFIQLQNSMEGVTKIMSQTKCFSLEDRKGEIFVSKAVLPSASNLISCESSHAASFISSDAERTENDAGKTPVIKIEASLPEDPPLSRTTYASCSSPRKKRAPKYKGVSRRRKRFRRTKGSKAVDGEGVPPPSIKRKAVDAERVQPLPIMRKAVDTERVQPPPIMRKAVDTERVSPPSIMRKAVHCELCPVAVSSKYALRRHQCISHNIHSYQRNGMCVNYTKCGSTYEMVTSSTTELWMQ